MNFNYSFAFILFLITLSSLFTKTHEKTNSTFHPTNEWQKIEEGQSIPPGLHVRVNLLTGYKEAKLVDASDKKDTKTSLITVRDNENDEKGNPLDQNKLKRIKGNAKSNNKSNNDMTKTKFRSYEEIKKDFDNLNMKVKTEIEIVSNLIENFKTSSGIIFKVPKDGNKDKKAIKGILTILADLEYLVHHFDNAREFAKLHGFPDVIHKCLNSTNAEIKAEALRLHGSATQSNPTVQIAALDSGSINLLLKVLAFDENLTVRSRSLYALSCLLRRFPAAQQKLINNGGLTVFAEFFDNEKQDFVKLQVKILTLIHDLLYERKDAQANLLQEEGKNETNPKLKDLKEKLKQYQEMNLEKKLLEQKWCKRISQWFVKRNFLESLENMKDKDKKNLISSNSDQLDIIQKSVDSIFMFSSICKSQFKTEKEFVKLLLTLKELFSILSLNELNIDHDIIDHS